MISEFINKHIPTVLVATVIAAMSPVAFTQTPTRTQVLGSDEKNTSAEADRTMTADLSDVKAKSKNTEDISASFRKDAGKSTVFPSRSSVRPPVPAKQTTSGSGWEISFAPYLYMTGIGGRVGARGRILDVDASFGNVLENLDFGLMGTIHAKKGKFIFVNDLIWTKMSNKRDTPGGAYSTAKLGVNLFILDPEIGYRVAESKAGSLDVLGGVRIWSVENNLNLTTGVLPGFDVSQRKSWAAPVVGLHGVLNLSEILFEQQV